MPLLVVDLVKVEGDSLGEIAQGFLDRAALAGDVDLKTLRDVPVLFLMYGGGQVPMGTHGPQCDTLNAVPSSYSARDAPHHALGGRPLCSAPRDGRSRAERGRRG